MSRKEKTYHFIYKTIDTRNGNFYIGMHSTDNLNDGYVGSGDRLRKLIHKHGKEIFKIEILEFLPNRESLKKREEEIVNSDLLKEEKCMNLRIGGEGGLKDDDHLKIFIEAGRKGREEKMKDPKYREHIGKFSGERLKKYHKEGKIKYDTFKDKKHSVETKKLMSESHKGKGLGKNNSQFGTCWITNGLNNKKIKKENELPNGWKLGRI